MDRKHNHKEAFLIRLLVIVAVIILLGLITSCKKEEKGYCYADYYLGGVVILTVEMADITPKLSKCGKRPDVYDSIVGRCD